MIRCPLHSVESIGMGPLAGLASLDNGTPLEWGHLAACGSTPEERLAGRLLRRGGVSSIGTSWLLVRRDAGALRGWEGQPSEKEGTETSKDGQSARVRI